jgi:predicted ATPase/DNA-binding CsgD family transcriptional regulator
MSFFFAQAGEFMDDHQPISSVLLVEPLTQRELQILALMVNNPSNNEMAESLHLALSSVKWFVQEIYTKLGVHNRRQAIARARETGLLDILALTPKVAPSLAYIARTFLLSDVVDSSRLLKEYPEKIQSALARLESILSRVCTAHGGSPIIPLRDTFQAVFPTGISALTAALEVHRLIDAENWGGLPIRLRISLHTSRAKDQAEDDSEAVIYRAKCLLSTGYGGQLLLTQASAELLQDRMPKGVRLQDLGIHLLKDLARPEHIYQVFGPGRMPDFPPLKSLENLPNNLPLQLSSFIGRKAETRELKRMLLEKGTRLVTLTGSGGTGKTRLAQQISADLLDTFTDGVWLVELAHLSEPNFVPQTVLTTINVQESPGRAKLDLLVEFLQPKHLLLILDNCEHLVQSCASLASTLLRACPLLQILVTSREILGIDGETTFRVPSLSLPGKRQLPPLEALLTFDAVRLFVERAQIVAPGFNLNEKNAAAIIQVVQRLDGIPLAIELAAARLRLLSVHQIATRLDDAFSLLTGSARTALPRHQTLQALIDWSYNLLSEDEQVVLRRLSIFTGDWTLDAVGAICADPQQSELITESPLNGQNPFHADGSFKLLSQLVDKSLVLTSDEPGSEMRYHMLETIRQYLQVKLAAAGEEKTIGDRHAVYYIQSLAIFLDKEPVSEHARYFQLNILNLLAAQEWVLKRQNWYLATAGAESVTQIWENPLIRETLSRILPDQYPTILDMVGRIYFERGLNDQAYEKFEQCLQLSLADPSIFNPGVPMTQLAETTLSLNRLADCRSFAKKAINWFDENSIPYLQMAQTDLAEVEIAEENYVGAWKLLRIIFPLARKHHRRLRIFMLALAGVLIQETGAQPERAFWAAKLLGSVVRLKDVSGDPLYPFAHTLIRRREDLIRQVLSDTEWTDAWNTGHNWMMDEAALQSSICLQQYQLT